MEKNEINAMMLEAIRCFLDGKKVSRKDGMSGDDWKEFFSLGQYHQILPMIYDAVYECPAFHSFSEKDVQQVKRLVIRQVMVQSRRTEEFLLLYRKLIEKGLTPVIVKGIICRNIYREPDYRGSGDEDFLIPREQFRRCHELFVENGMKPLDPDRDPDTEGEVPYYMENGTLQVELHKELFASDSEAYGDFNKLFSGVYDRMITEEIGGIQVYTMCRTDHLLYLILHAFKHFLHSGFGIRQVCDIMLFAETYGTEINWEYMLDKCREVHADVFAASLFNIGKKELNFNSAKAGYPASWEEAEADGSELLEDLIAGGVFGDSSMSRRHSSNITLQAVTESRRGKRTGGSLLRSLFPNRRYMERTYTYLDEYPFLLPAAWISRIRKYLKETKEMNGNDTRESIEIGNHRVNLMKKYKIIP